MQARVLRWIAVLGAVGVFAGTAVPDTHARVTEFSGTFFCNNFGVDLPLEGARVELWARGWEWLPAAVAGHVASTGRVDANGRFRLRSDEGEDNYWARVVLDDRHGMHVKDWMVPWVWFADTASRRNTEPYAWIGGLRMFDAGYQSPPCAVFMGIHRAADALEADGVPQPFRDLLITTSNVLNGGVPYTANTQINWPPGYPTGAFTRPRGGRVMGDGRSFVTSMHEFGHAIRHAFDGNALHFGFDAARFNYLRNHGPCFDGGTGFAFNEGWADYWAGGGASPPDCRNTQEGVIGTPGTADTNDMRVEGNVAAGLKRIETHCRLTRAQMAGVLRARPHPNGIHAFGEFHAAVRAIHGCNAPPNDPLPPDDTEQIAQSITTSRRDREARARAFVRSVDTSISSVARTLADAKREARRMRPCRAIPCDRELRAATLPPALAGQLAVLRLIRKELRPLDTTRELRRRARLSVRNARLDQRARARIDAGALRIERQMFTRIVAAAQRAARIDTEGTLKAFLADMRAKAAVVAAGGRSSLLGFAIGRLRNQLQPFEAAPPEDFGRSAEPAPPTPEEPKEPQPSGPVAEKLLLQCPAGGSANAPIHVTGKLDPAVAGATIGITWSAGPKQQGSTTVTTASDGTFAADLASYGAGTYEIAANYAGDSGHTSASATCTAELK